MSLYNILFNWYYTYIFNDTGNFLADVTFNIGGMDIVFSEWLCATASIITLCFLVAFLFLCVRYLFKVVAGLFTLRG